MAFIKVLSVLCFFLVSELATAQGLEGQETLVTSLSMDKNVDHGGFGAIVSKYARIGSSDATFVGARGAWIVNHAWILGASGYGLTSELGVKSGDDKGNLDLGYGGFLFGYNFFSSDLVHLNLLTNAGWGAMSIDSDEDKEFGLRDDVEDYDKDEISDTFTIIEPEVLVETNLYKYVRLGTGVSYRIVNAVDNKILRTKELEGWSATIAVNAGLF
ncbi:MAG: hypothetical protein AB7T49_15620 [Oligoflexales bacterium]